MTKRNHQRMLMCSLKIEHIIELHYARLIKRQQAHFYIALLELEIADIQGIL